MQTLIRSLISLVLTAGLAVVPVGALKAQVPAPPAPDRAGLFEVQDLTDRLADELITLREDIDVELPDARGRALAAQADRSLALVRHLQKSVRSSASPEHLHRHAAELARELHRFLDMTAALGPDGQFLRESAARIHALDHQLMKLFAAPAPRPE
jgi:hypothetical protein